MVMNVGNVTVNRLPAKLLRKLQTATSHLQRGRGRHRNSFQFHACQGERLEYLYTNPPESLVWFFKRQITDVPLQRVFCVRVPPQTTPEEWHYGADTATYYTTIVQVKVPSGSGATEFPDVQLLDTSEGACWSFNGLKMHRGAANLSGGERVFVYATHYDDSYGEVVQGPFST